MQNSQMMNQGNWSYPLLLYKPKKGGWLGNQSQLPQPFLIGEMTQTLNCCCGPSLDPLHYVHVSLVLGSPELDTALQVWPLQSGVEGKDRQKSCSSCTITPAVARLWRGAPPGDGRELCGDNVKGPWPHSPILTSPCRTSNILFGIC